jgi:hypothetical protein
MKQFSALLALAARRGDGLKPDLMRLLARSRADAEASPATMADDVGNPLEAQNERKETA